MNLPGVVEHQGVLAAKLWAHGVHHIEVYGTIIGGESGADVIQASGQASWADLVWIKTSKYMKGQHVTTSSGVNFDA